MSFSANADGWIVIILFLAAVVTALVLAVRNRKRRHQ